jgi:hypothetical protein
MVNYSSRKRAAFSSGVFEALTCIGLKANFSFGLPIIPEACGEVNNKQFYIR